MKKLQALAQKAARTRVANTLRAAREARGLSLSSLARVSGIGKATLSGLETGTANPTLETLWDLSAALGVSLGELVDPPHPQPSLLVIRATEGTLVRGTAVVGRLVSAFESGSHRHEIFECSVLKKKQVSPAHAPGVTEHVLVTAGRLRVGPVERPVDLGTGDFLRMSPVWPHVYQGLETETRMVLVMQWARR
jgi:transcriptional regulator with XRE-family HTH domain